MEEIKYQLIDQQKRFLSILAKQDLDTQHQEIRQLEAQTMKEGFWNDQENARVVSRKLSDKQKQLQILEQLESRIKNALELVDEPEMQQDLEKEIKEIEHILADLELKLFLS